MADETISPEVQGLLDAHKRIVEAKQAHDAINAAAGQPSPSFEQQLGFKYLPGDKVLDLITGMEGVVQRGKLKRSVSEDSAAD